MRILKLTAAALAATTMLCGTSFAATQQSYPAAKFSTEEAAYCTATFGWVLQVLAPQGMSKEAVVQTNIAFMMWNYELNISAPTASDATMQAAADVAVNKLTANFPAGKTQEDAQKIISFVTQESANCGSKLAAAYPNGTHPVIAQIQLQAEAARAAKATAAAE